jgi:GNAT superfamily N-acetyltransferase
VTARAPRTAAANDSRVRAAEPSDAPAISAFYARCYSSADGRTPTDNYPFPQILHPDWVQAVLETQMVAWLIAEAEGRVIGAAGLLKGLRSRRDDIGECFGLVVDPAERRAGVASVLLAALRTTALRQAAIAIGQMRTADPAVASIVRGAGFHPVGFEPFVHRMLAGDESMVAVAMLSSTALAQRKRTGCTTEAVRRLAELVLAPLELSPLDVANGARPANASAVGRPIRLKEIDAELGIDLMQRLPDCPPDAPGFVDLRRMDELGRDQARRKQRFFAGLVDHEVVGCIHVAHNRHDHHLRIENFAWLSPDSHDLVLRELLALVERESAGEPAVVVAEMTATSVAEQRTVESLGFTPTSYYPALVVHDGARLDVVQYTRLLGRPVAESVHFLDDLEWPAAQRVVGLAARELARA